MDELYAGCNVGIDGYIVGIFIFDAGILVGVIVGVAVGNGVGIVGVVVGAGVGIFFFTAHIIRFFLFHLFYSCHYNLQLILLMFFYLYQPQIQSMIQLIYFIHLICVSNRSLITVKYDSPSRSK